MTTTAPTPSSTLGVLAHRRILDLARVFGVRMRSSLASAPKAQLAGVLGSALSDEIWFEQVARGTPGGLGPTDYFLVAVMRFSPDALATVVKNGTRTGDKSPGILPAANRAESSRAVG